MMFRQALAAETAALATFLVLYALCAALHAGAAPAILGTVIALGIARRPAPGERVHVLVEAAGLIGVAVFAALVGFILRWNLLAGGAIFSLGLAASVWLRGLHDDARVIGRAAALPFIAILVVPVGNVAGAGRLLLLVAPLVALAIATFARRIAPSETYEGENRRASTLKPPPHVRMSLQLFVALALAFLVGYSFFPAHWPWIVLTAFIVCGGALGSADAVHKGALRLFGALAGGIVAAVAAFTLPQSGIVDTIAIFVALFAGLLLRSRSYVYWAACTTLIFAMLQRADAAFSWPLYAARLECIVVGAACGIAAACAVLPIKTSDIARRRLADALAAFERGAYVREARDLYRLASPLRLNRVLTLSFDDAEHPAVWLAQARLLLERDSIECDRERLAAAIRNARRAIRDKNGISGALARVHEVLTSSP